MLARPPRRSDPRQISGPRKVAFLGTYLPRRCGIATFSEDLLSSLRREAPEAEWWSVAVNDIDTGYDYPPEVHFEVGQKTLADYRKAVDFLNMNEIDSVCLQHEFGIFGGVAGSYVLRPLEELRTSVVTTLHTVLQEPSQDQAKVISALSDFSDRLIVMSKRGRDILTSVNGVPPSRVTVIPHGVPDVPFLDTSYHKDRFDLVGRKVLLSFGLIGPGKGIEDVIEALPAIARVHPEVVYAVIGATHPDVKRRQGETYRLTLQRRALDLGVDNHVAFYDQFIDTPTLLEFLSTADVCITPYQTQEQISSGVLSYALGSGKAIVSTPFWYAEEMLADGRGRLVPFRDPEAIAHEVIALLSDDVARNAMRKRAYDSSRHMVWSEVAGDYLKVLRQVRRRRTVRLRDYRVKTLQNRPFELPNPNFDHMRVLSDGTGILQHARFDVPDRDHGYCTDDNARALIARNVLAEGNDLSDLAHTYLAFLHQAFNPENGRFRNFMSYDRRWLEPVGSEDAHGRAVWALGTAVAEAPAQGMASAAMALFERALPCTVELTALRSCAHALLGVEAYLRLFDGATEVRRAGLLLAERIFGQFTRRATADWPWPEDVVTWGNGMIPHALLLSGSRLGRKDMVDTALRSLTWLTRVQTDEKGHFVPIGSNGWFPRGGAKARFDQQPIEVQHMVDAQLEAYRITGERLWLDEARRSFEWFLGRNDLRQPVCDLVTGGSCDGVQPEGLNRNQGAESTLAWLHVLIRMHVVLGAAAEALHDFAAIRPSTASAVPVLAAAADTANVARM